ncbi:DUF4401 domain-containing protein [Taibaiella koreensis]|uniref:DUF4401 domain-containing protein n=1 Tax=Taibaiella koreensis TaxID=1268548 RepID=UPI000E59D260|nr:DUF4401 domain-containing protein [Taibaiella koreensis]
MKREQKINGLLQQIGATEGDGFAYDKEQLQRAIGQSENAYANIVIKILSGAGGFLATLALLGFFFVAGLYKTEPAMIISGIISIALAIGGSRIANHTFFDTVAITLYITGFVLAGIGMGSMGSDSNVILILFMIVSIAGVLISGGFMMTFVSVLLFNGSFFAIFPVNHLYGYIAAVPMLFVLAALYWLTANEHRILAAGSFWNKLYQSLQSGFFISFLAGLIWMVHQYDFGFGPMGYGRLLSVAIDIGILLLVAQIIKSLQIVSKVTIVAIYLLTIVLLLPVFNFAYIPGALFLLLLSVRYGYKVEIGLSIAALAYFIIKYYYDLRLSLLYKSGLLFFPGLLLLLVWYFYNRQLKRDEKI